MVGEFTKPSKIQPAIAGNIAEPDQYNQNIAGQSKDTILGVNVDGNFADADLGDEAVVANGALIKDIKVREGKELKVYDANGALQNNTTLSDLGKYNSNGANIASAATVNLNNATGDAVDITGTTTITAITLAEGALRIVRFTGALILTNGASLVLPTGANITTAAGDYAVFKGYAAGVVRVVGYTRASGAPLAPGPITKFDSGNQTIASSGTLLLNHGLGGIPDYVRYTLIFTTAQGNWSINDVIDTLPNEISDSLTDNLGFESTITTTQVQIRFGSRAQVFDALNKTTRAGFNITNGNIRLIVKAFKFG